MGSRQNYLDIEFRMRGFTGWCGLEFTEISDDGVTISCKLRPELLNPNGIAHGGLIATMMDVSAGSMALQIDRVRHDIVTQSCNIHYLRPGIGTRLEARSRIIRKGKRVCVVQTECFSDDGKMIATSIYEIAYLEFSQEGKQ